jgi:chorismate-pyruvate lyase
MSRGGRRVSFGAARLSGLLACAALYYWLALPAPGAAQQARCDAAGAHEAVTRLDQALLSQPSASVTLTQWCRAQGLMGADEPLRAVLVGDSSPPADETRRRLQVGPDERVGYRHVQLRCGAHLVSDAENWFVPSRLTPAMNEELASTDHPFGLVVKALDFTRCRLDERPLAAGPAAEALAPSSTVLQHRATLVARTGEPFSLVVENYKADLVCAGAP